MLENIGALIAVAPRGFVEAGQRVYWVYLFSSLMLAVVWVFFSQAKGEGAAQKLKGLSLRVCSRFIGVCKLSPEASPDTQDLYERVVFRRLLPTRIFLHKSALLDYQLWLINPIVASLIGGFALISAVPVALWIAGRLAESVGEPWWSLDKWQVYTLYTVCLFVADDLSRFLLHWAMHRIPVLWSIHRLHHSAKVLTPWTVYRIHPIESLLYTNRMVLTQAGVLGVFFYAFGMRLSVWEFAGVNALTYVFNMAGANLRHSHIRFGFGKPLERFFISPAQHQLHHSNRHEHFDKNYGSFLAIWDWVLGTLIVSTKQRRHGFGLSTAKISEHLSIADAYLEPIMNGYKVVLRALGKFALADDKTAIKPLKVVENDSHSH